jgi:hypothetical protein
MWAVDLPVLYPSGSFAGELRPPAITDQRREKRGRRNLIDPAQASCECLACVAPP